MSEDVKPWDLFDKNQPKSEEELIAYRLDICRQCEFFRARTEQCKKCKCFMKLKTRLKNAHCPINKW